jgi:hypothetical protein
MELTPENSVWEIIFTKLRWPGQDPDTLTLIVHSPNILTALETAENLALNHGLPFVQVNVSSAKYLMATHN